MQAVPHEPLGAHAEPEPAESAREKLRLAVSLAGLAEQERRLGRWESARDIHRAWEETMAEVKVLLPRVRASGGSVFAQKKAKRGRCLPET